MKLPQLIKKIQKISEFASTSSSQNKSRQVSEPHSLGAASLAQSLEIENAQLVFGVHWAPLSSDTNLGSLLNNARLEGFAYYVHKSYLETVGLIRSLPPKSKKAYSAALILSQHFSQGGTELFVFRQNERFALVGLVDYSPIPGFDAIGSSDEIQQLAQEFKTLNASQLIRHYGNTDWNHDVEEINLINLAQKTKISRNDLKRLPNRKFQAILVASSLAVIGIIYAGYDYYQSLLAEQVAVEQAFLNDPNRLYEKSVTEALQKTGPPGATSLELWRDFFSKLPIAINGWTAHEVTCISTRCDVAWARTSGNFKDFDAAMPSEISSQKRIQLDKGLTSTEINTSHDLSKFIKPENANQFIERNHLTTEVDAKKLWGSELQDISLLSSATVTMNSPALFGPSASSVDVLNKPIVKGTWSIDHESWSLMDLKIPDFVVPETLRIKVDLKYGIRYKLEGSYYAKGK